MNHIYKVVWSKVRNCYVAVSEIAKGHGKKSTSEKWGGKKAALLAAVIFTLGIGGTVGAKGSAAIENGPASNADGIASIAVGVGDKVVSSNTDENHYQGATSIAVGTLNTIDADADAPFDGAASSVVGQVNYTKNTNAAVIMGAGNKVTNSYREVKLDEKTLQELIQAYQKKDMKTVTEILQKAVPESGGQVMVMGGGNTVDYAQDSQVMGVSNTLKGTKDAVSQYNLVDGFQNKVTNVQHTYVVGTNNTVDNTKNTIIHGDDNTVDKNGGKDSDNTRILGSGNKVEGSSSQVVIGDKNTITGRDEGTNSGNRISGISDITIGQGNYLGGAYTYRNTWDTLTVIGNNNNGKEHQEISSGIIIGDNQTIGGPEGIIDSIAIGSLSPSEQAEKDGKTAKYVVGRNSTIIGYHTTNPNGESVVIGNRSQANSQFETITGPRSIIEGAGYDSDTGNFSSIYGAFNTIKNGSSQDDVDGFGNSINGSLNVTSNARGTMIMGVGNTVEHSKGQDYTAESAAGEATTKDFWLNDLSFGGDYYNLGVKGDLDISYDDMRRAIHDYMAASGGAVSVLGNSNTADYAIRSQILGTGNILKGSEDSTSAYNTISGFANTGSNVNRTSIVGTGNNLKNGEDNVVIGDYHQLDGGKHNVILGSMASKEQEVKKTSVFAALEAPDIPAGTDSTITYTVKEQVPVKANTSNIENAVMLGYNTDVTQSGGVAVGSGSVASIDKGAVGYDLKGEDHSGDTTGTWKSTAAAVSVGDAATKMTRQITNVAAGTEDTDAVNVAQLKQARTKYYSVNEKAPNVFGDAAKEYAQYLNDDNKGAKEFAGLASGYMTYAGGIASTVTGSFSGIMNEVAQPGSNDFRGAAALSYGTFNINNNTGASQRFSGVANSIIGQANMTTDSNAALIYGAGNSVTNSYRAIDLQKAGAIMQNLKDPKALNSALKDAVPTSGGQVMVMGGGNTVTSAYMTQVVGVGNTVTGNDKEYAEGTSTQLNYVDGFYNTVENGRNDYVIGSHNTITGSSVDTNKSNLVLGDNHKLTDRKNNVILGSADDKDTVTDASDAVIIGHNANVSVDGGVAIGSGSIATVNKDVAGYKPYAKADTSKDPKGTWTATDAAISFGKADGTMTRQITGVAAGTALTDAVNVAQLKSVMNMPVNIYNGGKMASDSYTAGTKISNNWNLSNLQFDFGDGLKAQEVGDDGDKRVLVTLDKNALKGDPDFKGDKGDTGPQGPAGKDGKDGINGKDGAVGPQGPAGKDGINGKDGKDGKDGINGKDGKDGKDGGVGTVVGDDTNITAVNTETDATKPANYKVSLNKEITVAKVTAGDTTVSGDGVSIAGGPSMTTNGIDAAGKKITHVAAGTETTDAVNYGQLKDVESKVDSNSQAITNINSHVNRLDNRINKVGAGAAALAGLHPLDFDPSDKWNFAVGYGNYRNANSVAVGAFYRPNENTMFSVGTNFGNGENMVNAGVSFKLGQGSSYAGVSKAELAEENQKLKANDAAQDQKIQKQEKEIQELKKALEELKSHIK